MTTIDLTRWPCLQTEGLKVFNATADQRYLLGEETFLHTHFPMKMRRYRNGKATSLMTEIDLIDDLVAENDSLIGNRVFFLYGAAGAGKSELLRWIQASITRQYSLRAQNMVRVNRNELDVLSIVEKFRLLLSNNFFSQNTHQRWEEARHKPRTVAKLILLSALEKIFDSDEIINTLYYRLLEWIQPRVERALVTEKVGEEHNTPVELLSREDLSEMQAQSVFTVNLEYEQFRYYLSKAFQDLLLEGISLPDTLRQISTQLTLTGQRPILLVDDLVQSLSIFSTDLLDYFITLDEGNWDVVIGLTPNALNDNDRGKQLLDRITYLDTFDDRVTKLFLSDARGDESYFLNVENSPAFLAPYLEMFRSINGMPCYDCPFHEQCSAIFGQDGDALLAPFNTTLIHRIFNNLPDGKGKARQFLRVIREILHVAITTRQMETALVGQVKLDLAVESPDKRLSTLVECYFPTVKELEKHKVSIDFLSAFNFAINPVVVNLQPLGKLIASEPNLNSHTTWLADANSLVVKDWLDSKPVNRQSLQSLRRGTARWLRDFMSIGYIHRPNKPKPHRILRWNGVFMDVRPPILLEGVDNESGIYLSPQIGILAFQLNEYALANGARRIDLAGSIASNIHSQQIIHQARNFQANLEATITCQLGRSPDQLAAEIIALLWMLGDAPYLERIPLFNLLPVTTLVVPNSQISIKVLEYAHMLFEDFFMLREQLYDYAKFHQYLNKSPLDKLTHSLLNIDATMVSPEFVIGDIPLGDYIAKIQQRILIWQNPLLSSDINFVHATLIRSFAEYGIIGMPFASIPSDIWGKIKVENPDVFQRLRIYLDSDSSARTH